MPVIIKAITCFVLQGKVLGDASRTCLLDEEKKAAEWGAPDYSDCTSEEMLRVSEQVSVISQHSITTSCITCLQG